MMLEDYCVIDLEMTGLNPKHHKILEVAAVRVRKKRNRQRVLHADPAAPAIRGKDHGTDRDRSGDVSRSKRRG